MLSTVQADDSAALRSWLQANHFDDSVATALSSYSVADVLALTKSDLKDLIGVQQGIRLYTRIAQHKAMIEGGKYKSTASPVSSSLSPRLHSRYGQCSQRDCPHPTVAVCSVPECGASLCVWHESKSLFTGQKYCPRCEAETMEGKLRAALVNATHTADAATDVIIHKTAEWAHSGKDALGVPHWSPAHLDHSSHSSHGLPVPGGYHTTGWGEEKQPPYADAKYADFTGRGSEEGRGGVGATTGGVGGGVRLPFVSDWLRGDEDGEEVEEGQHYRETSWNDRATNQCVLQ